MHSTGKPLTWSKWRKKWVTCPFTPTNRINIGRLAIHKLKSLMAIEKQLKHSSQDVCYSGNTDNLGLLKINNFHFHSRFKFVRLHFLGQHKQKRCKGTTSRPFSHDVIAAILVDHNDEMSVMLVHQNNPWELSYIFTHIVPFVSWNQYGHWSCDWKRLKQNNHTLKVSRASQIISHIGKVFEGSLLAVHLPCTSGKTILQENLIRPLEVSLSQMLRLFFPPDP